MAFRTWARVLSAALCVGALAAAGQLGMAYGLRLVRIARTFDVTMRDHWVAQLTWVCWIATVAAVVGAVAAGRLATRVHRPPSGGSAVLLAAVSAVGASAVVPLTLLPARSTQAAGLDPVLAVGLCAGLGTVIGAMAGYVALAHPVARWSLGTMIGAVWAIGLGCVLTSIAEVDPPPVRLGVLDWGSLATTQRAALLTMPALALVAGAALGWVARRQGRTVLTVGLAGLPGPALLTLAYLISGPGDSRFQQVPYWAAMLAAGAGSLGSVLAAVIGRDDERSRAADDAAPERAGSDDTDPPAPTGPGPAVFRPGLPRRARRTAGASGAGPSADPGHDGPASPTDTTPDSSGRSDSGRSDSAPSDSGRSDSGRSDSTPSDSGRSTGGPRHGSPAIDAETTGDDTAGAGAAGAGAAGAGAAGTPLPAPPAWPTEAQESNGPDRGGRRSARDDRARQSVPRSGRPAAAPSPATPAPPTPQQVSPPLPTPTPASAPLPPPRPTDRHPGAGSAGPAGEPRRAARGKGADGDKGKGLRPRDEEYVEWVSGLNDDE